MLRLLRRGKEAVPRGIDADCAVRPIFTLFVKGMRFASIVLGTDRINSVERMGRNNPLGSSVFYLTGYGDRRILRMEGGTYGAAVVGARENKRVVQFGGGKWRPRPIEIFDAL